MDFTTTRCPMGATVSLAAAATAITLMAGTVALPAPHLSGESALRVSTQAVTLTADPFEQIWAIATGADSNYPLPAGANPIAPITEQVVRSAVTYAQQLATGQGQQIPAEISRQAANLANAVPNVAGLLVEDVAIVPVAAFSAAFLSLLVIGSLPASASALASLPGIWLTAVARPPQQWAYNGLAIRNTIAVALQPPASTLQLVPGASAAATGRAPAPAESTGPESTTGLSISEPENTGAEPGLRTRAKRLSIMDRLTTPGLPRAKKGATPASESALSPAPEATATHPSKRSNRPVAETGGATTQHKSSRHGKRRLHQQAASEASAE